jgi:uncharacterized iron-regulated membrane protein
MEPERANSGRNKPGSFEPDVASNLGSVRKSTNATRDMHKRYEWIRKLWLNVHLCIGLFVGAIFVIIGLSGSILAFRVEIDEWLNSDLLINSAISERNQWFYSYDDLIAASKNAAPGESTPFFVHFPKRQTAYFDVIYATPTARRHKLVHQVVVNQFTASVVGRRLLVDTESHFSEPFVNIVTHVHYTLLQGALGETVVGFAGLFLLASLVSGVYLWWPRNGKWRQAFSIKHNASFERFILDLHKAAGVYFCTILLVMLFSGIYMIFMPQVRALVSTFSSATKHIIPEDLKSEPANGRAPIGADVAVEAADRLFPDGKLMSLQLPDGPEGVYVVGKRAPDEINVSEPSRLVAVDQYAGTVVRIQNPHDFTAGERFLEWQYPLHTGEAFGDAGRAIICFVGLIPTLLYSTGVTRWLRKRRAKRSHSNQPAF